jgi:hypothetical protein
MATTIVEAHLSRAGSSSYRGSIDLIYYVYGTSDDATARADLDTASPATHDGLFKDDISVRPLMVEEGNDAGCLWEGTVHYVAAQSANFEIGDNVYSFETGGESEHITVATRVGAYGYRSDGSTPAALGDFGGGIGVTEDGAVEGVSVPSRIYRWSERVYMDPDDIDAAYRQAVSDVTWCVNAATFRGYAAGEVLFEGASGSVRGEEDWEIAFKFSRRPNASGLQVGSITGIAKRGWEYLWVRYLRQADGYELPPVPVAVYVEEVFPEGDFSVLGI